MFCQNCGNQLNEGAAFCPKCGTKSDAVSGISVQSIDENNIKPIKPKKRKRGIVIVLIVIVLIAFAWFSRYSGDSSHSNVNNGKGADDPIKAAQACMLSIQYGDTSYIEKYLDEQMDNDIFISSLEEYIEALDSAGVGEINMDGVTYDVGETYKEYGNTYVRIDIEFWERGLFGGNATIRKTPHNIYLILHSAPTPDGEKWFLGKVPSSVHDDNTGLR